MAEANFLSIFFKILNFLIFTAILIYLYVKFILPEVKKSINLDKLKIKNLKDIFKDNNKNIDQVKNSYVIEQARLEDLTIKVQKWKDISIQQENRQAKENQLIVDDISQKRIEQGQNLSNTLLERDLAPKALSLAEKELKEIFTESAQLDYLNKITNFMQMELQDEK